MLRVLALVAVAMAAMTHGAPRGSTGFNVEIYGNSVMRGTPVCTSVQPNGFNLSLGMVCPDAAVLGPSGVLSARVTGTLTPDTEGWHRFAGQVDKLTWVRLWVDDHRIVDAWGSHNGPSPVTPGLLPNVSLSTSRPVFIRVDLRPWSSHLAFGLDWTSSSDSAATLIPQTALSPVVSSQQQKRRELQEKAATGWNQWIRSSNLAQVVLPQQVGIDLGILNTSSGEEYRKALLNPQFHGAPAVIMGHHAYDGSFASVSFVKDGINFTVESATAPPAAPSAESDDNVVVITTNTTQDTAANLDVVVHASAFWGAAANISFIPTNPPRLEFETGDLGIVTVTFSSSATLMPGKEVALQFHLTTEPLVFWLTCGPPHVNPDFSSASKIIETQRTSVIADIQSAATLSKSQFDTVDAMSSVIAWNVNFDPRVAVTAPVSRTFEAGFDFIFFDWDMFFLSLMAASAPAANNPHAFAIGVSNLIEVAQTRSAYGQVMNKRAASGSSSSDTNDRTEPIVGAMVMLRLWEDAKGTDREDTMLWVAELLYPTLFRWNQWCWEYRRYFGSGTGGLLVLGSDNHLPCEGSTVGLNNSRQVCASSAAAVLESGMDNSPMYYNSFPDPKGGKGIAAGWDATANKIQLYDVQMSSLFVSESLALQDLANITGNYGTIPLLQNQSSTMETLVNTVLWDDKTGIYRQVDASSAQRGFSPRLSPTSFYPMISGMSSQSQVTRMVKEHLTNEKEFCVNPDPTTPAACPYAMPSISRDDPSFFDNDYWRGRAWGPLNLLVWIGLSNPKYSEMPEVLSARRGLCAQSENLLLQEFRSFRHVHENYNSTSGRGGDVPNSNPYYHWGALFGYIGLRENMGQV